MKNIDWLISKAENYDLKVKKLNENKIQLWSEKFFFDSWIIEEAATEIRLWHMSKKHNIKNCSYHLQKTYPKKNKWMALLKIKEHNTYRAFYKGRKKENMVDRILGGERERWSIV